MLFLIVCKILLKAPHFSEWFDFDEITFLFKKKKKKKKGEKYLLCHVVPRLFGDKTGGTGNWGKGGKFDPKIIQAAQAETEENGCVQTFK